ncbi:MAG: NUDIX domain-containing protein [Nitrospirota bacterium]
MRKKDLKGDRDDELLEIVNENGEVMGHALRSDIHGNPSLIHKVVHVLVLNSKGKLLLQKRSPKKDVAPGRWDTSVGGHVGPGEDLLSSAKREMEEELGIRGSEPVYLYSYIHRNSYETELVTTFRCFFDGEIIFNQDEIENVRFWSIEEIKKIMGTNILSDNFEQEFHYLYGLYRLQALT